jgi:hypothetical protein
MAEVIPFPSSIKAERSASAAATLRLGTVLERYADSVAPMETHHEAYPLQGRSVLIICSVSLPPIVITSDELTKLITIELPLGTVRPEHRYKALDLLNGLNCQTEFGHFEHFNGGIQYRNSCRLSAIPQLPPPVIDSLNLERVADLVENARFIAADAAAHFAEVIG